MPDYAGSTTTFWAGYPSPPSFFHLPCLLPFSAKTSKNSQMVWHRLRHWPKPNVGENGKRKLVTYGQRQGQKTPKLWKRRAKKPESFLGATLCAFFPCVWLKVTISFLSHSHSACAFWLASLVPIDFPCPEGSQVGVWMAGGMDLHCLEL